MDLNLNGVSTIVYQEYDGPLLTADHCRDILCGHLLSINPKFRTRKNSIGKSWEDLHFVYLSTFQNDMKC